MTTTQETATHAGVFERVRQRLDLGPATIEMRGTLSDILDVYAAPNDEGWLVEARLKTSDAEAVGIAKSQVQVHGDATPEQLATLGFQRAMDLLAHEVLEGMHAKGEPLWDAHEGGGFQTEPPMLRGANRG